MHTNIEKMRGRVRRLFIAMLVLSFLAGMSPLYLAIAEVGVNGTPVVQVTPAYDFTRKIQTENEMLKKQIEKLQEENKLLKEKLEMQTASITTYKKQMQALKDENAKLKKEVQTLKAKNIYLENLAVSLNKTLMSKLEDLQPALKKVAGIRLEKFTTTAYAPSAGGINCSGDCNTTAKLFKVSAIKDLDNITYCAVDPKVVPLYSILIVQGLNKPCVAVDTGGKIKGYHIDILMHSEDEAKRWGRKTRMVIIIPPQ